MAPHLVTARSACSSLSRARTHTYTHMHAHARMFLVIGSPKPLVIYFEFVYLSYSFCLLFSPDGGGEGIVYMCENMSRGGWCVVAKLSVKKHVRAFVQILQFVRVHNI